MNTTWEQLEGAALSLARSGPIKDRLAEAYRNHLALVNTEELPVGLRADFHACHDALTRERPLRGEDAVRATVRKLSSHEADELACNVVRLFAAMVRESARESARESMREAARDALPAAAQALVNGAAAGVGARTPRRKAVPQVISLYSAEASVSRA